MLAGAGVAAAGAAVAACSKSEAPVAVANIKWDHETDVVCVGSGAAACGAAIAAKHGVIGLTKTGSIEYAPKSIRLNNTPMFRGALEANGFEESNFAEALSLFGRIGKSEEVAEASAWLCSDTSSYVTGHSLAVEAGYLTR